MPKNPKNDDIRDFDYVIAAKEVKIFNDFMHGECMTHSELLGIATNLVHINGGLKFMKECMDKGGSYTENNYNILPYIRKQKYSPRPLQVFSPYEEDHQHRNILEAGKLPRGFVRRTQPFQTISLAEGREKLEAVVQSVKASDDTKIHIICAPTGIGKTRHIEYWENAVVGFPDHKLKKEVAGRMKIEHRETPNLFDYLSASDWEVVSHCHKVGAYRKAAEFVYRRMESKGIYSTDIDKRVYAPYLQEMSMAFEGGATVLTTHAKIQSTHFHQNEIIYDEDPFTSAFLPMQDAYISDIIEILPDITNRSDKSAFTNLLSLVLGASYNTIYKLPPFALNNYSEVERLAVNNRNLKGNILDFINCREFLKNENDATKLHFIKESMPPENKKIIIFSATANEWIYRQLFGERIEYHGVGNIELQGKLVQDTTYSLSRYQMQKKPNVIKYASEKVEDRMVITFKEFTSKFKNSYKNIYFGNCQGKDTYQGKPLAIIGTPHVSPAAYYLYANYLGLNLRPEDFRQEMHPVHNNGLYFNFYTFENEILRNLQFYFVERELRQAVGRARLISRSDADVLLLSNYPLPEAWQQKEV